MDKSPAISGSKSGNVGRSWTITTACLSVGGLPSTGHVSCSMTMWSPSAPRAVIGARRPPGWIGEGRKPSRKARDSFSPCSPMSSGTSMSVPQHRRNILLPVQHARRLQPLHRPLGHPGIDEEADVESWCSGRSRNIPARSPRIITRQRPAVHRQGLQGVHPPGNDARADRPYYPQSNGKLERWHGTRSRGMLRPGTPQSLEDARRVVAGIGAYNTVRLQAPSVTSRQRMKLAGREAEIFTARDRKLEEAREHRKTARREAASARAVA